MPEAEPQQTDEGIVPHGDGWWIANAREMRWIKRDGRGVQVPFTGWTAEEAEGFHRMLGVNLVVLGPGEPQSVYHRETDEEGFLILDGDALLLVDGEERRLRKWDYFHCPVGVSHTIIGAGDHGCVVLAASSRVNQGDDQGWGAYTVDPLALKHGVGVEEETPDADFAYSRWKPSEPVRYDGWLPGD